MEKTEFARVPEEEGYYISSNAPPSGEFVPIGYVQTLIAEAHMAGQYNCGDGVDPSYSAARAYSVEKLGL